MPGSLKITIADLAAWASETLSTGLGALETGSDALGDARPLELGDCAEDVHLQLAGGRRGYTGNIQGDSMTRIPVRAGVLGIYDRA
jgi:hypothetical protein